MYRNMNNGVITDIDCQSTIFIGFFLYFYFKREKKNVNGWVLNAFVFFFPSG